MPRIRKTQQTRTWMFFQTRCVRQPRIFLSFSAGEFASGSNGYSRVSGSAGGPGPRPLAGARHGRGGRVLAATLSGARGYKAISEWVNDLSPKVLAHFGVRCRNRTRIPPSRTVTRDVLVRVDPRQLDDALRAWTAANGGTDSALAIDGKTMRGAIDDDGRRSERSLPGCPGPGTAPGCGFLNWPDPAGRFPP